MAQVTVEQLAETVGASVDRSTDAPTVSANCSTVTCAMSLSLTAQYLKCYAA